MALTLKTRSEQIELTDTLNGFTLNYRYDVADGNIKNSVSCSAVTGDGRHVSDISSNDGTNFYGNINQTASDDLSGLNEKMKADIIAIFADPTLFEPAV